MARSPTEMVLHIVNSSKRGPAGCLEWQRARSGGYGNLVWGGRWHKAHRLMWALLKGDPGALVVCHRCDNPICVEITHLFLGTQRDNMRDAARKGRWPAPQPKPACSAEGCDRERIAKDLCPLHYSRKRIQDAPACCREGCTRPRLAKGLCAAHYNRGILGMDLSAPIRPTRGPVCTVDGCSGKHLAKGLCNKHYHVSRRQ